jgi:hypothetical protein
MSTMEPPPNPFARQMCRPLLSFAPFNRVVHPNELTGWKKNMTSTQASAALLRCMETDVLTDKLGKQALRPGQTPLLNPLHCSGVWEKSCMRAKKKSPVHFKYAFDSRSN